MVPILCKEKKKIIGLSILPPFSNGRWWRINIFAIINAIYITSCSKLKVKPPKHLETRNQKRAFFPKRILKKKIVFNISILTQSLSSLKIVICSTIERPLRSRFCDMSLSVINCTAVTSRLTQISI